MESEVAAYEEEDGNNQSGAASWCKNRFAGLFGQAKSLQSYTRNIALEWGNVNGH